MTDDESAAGPGAGTVRRRAVAAVVALALLVGLVLLVRWWTHPGLLESAGNGFRGTLRAGGTLHVGVTYPPSDGGAETLTFRGARARFDENSAEAEATFWICDGETPLGGGRGPLRGASCPDPRPLEDGTRMTWSGGAGGDYVVVSVTPERPGVARLVGVDLDYALGADHLFRRGTDTLDLDVTIRAR